MSVRTDTHEIIYLYIERFYYQNEYEIQLEKLKRCN